MTFDMYVKISQYAYLSIMNLIKYIIFQKIKQWNKTEKFFKKVNWILFTIN